MCSPHVSSLEIKVIWSSSNILLENLWFVHQKLQTNPSANSRHLAKQEAVRLAFEQYINGAPKLTNVNDREECGRCVVVFCCYVSAIAISFPVSLELTFDFFLESGAILVSTRTLSMTNKFAKSKQIPSRYIAVVFVERLAIRLIFIPSKLVPCH